MIVGNGLVANGFKQYDSDDVVIFASGVSHSAGNNAAEFYRETALLKDIIQLYPQKKLAYFSTCSVYDPTMQSSPYVLHKLEIENLLRNEHNHHYIFRVSNLAGKTPNPHTVLNFIFLHIAGNIPFLLWKNAYRNIIDIEDAATICNDILHWQHFENTTTNIANPTNYSVEYIVQTIENFTGKKANCQIIIKESIPNIDTGILQPFFQRLNIRFSDDYLLNILRKYFIDRL